MPESLPDGLVRSGGGHPFFSQDSVPAGLGAAHALAPGRWGMLHILEGSLVFVDETTGVEKVLAAPQTHVILPEMLQHVRVSGSVSCRIDLYHAPGDA